MSAIPICHDGPCVLYAKTMSLSRKNTRLCAHTHIRKHIWSSSDSKGYGLSPGAVKLTNYSCSQERRIGFESRILCHSLDSQRRREMRLPIPVAREPQVV